MHHKYSKNYWWCTACCIRGIKNKVDGIGRVIYCAVVSATSDCNRNSADVSLIKVVSCCKSSSKIHSVFLQNSAHHNSAISVSLNSWRIKKCSTALFEICHVDLVSLLLLNFILEWFTYQEYIMGFCVAWDLFLEWGKDSTVTKS